MSTDKDDSLHADNDEQLHAENGSTRPYSIDEALELEHSLTLDSPMATHFPHTKDTHSRVPSMDVAVLQHLITQLRESLEKSEAKRDDALEKMRIAEEEAGEAKSALKLEREGFSETVRNLTERCTKLEDEAITMRLKSDADEHAIGMLRTKVEESRRGLMRLQSENRRTSTQLPPPTGLAALVTPTSKRDKRASFTPLTGSMQHRRMSSMDHVTGDSGLLSPTGSSFSSTSPVPGAAFHAQMNEATPPPALSRFGPLFSNASPPKSVDSTLPSPEPPHNSLSTAPLTEEIDSLKKDLAGVKAELTTTKATLETVKHELLEATEAKEASEQCVLALRSYISDAKVGESSTSSPHISLPPLPSMTNGEEEANGPKTATPAPASTWGFGKLWKVDTTVAKPAAPVNISPVATTPPMSNLPPLSRKFGSFWSSSRASISSMSSSETKPPVLTATPSYLNTAESDTSSVTDSVEPLSPDHEIDGDADITVRSSSASSVSQAMKDVALTEEVSKAPAPEEPVVVVSSS